MLYIDIAQMFDLMVEISMKVKCCHDGKRTSRLVWFGVDIVYFGFQMPGLKQRDEWRT